MTSPANTLHPGEKAQVLVPAGTGTAIDAAAYSVVSSDPTKAAAISFNGATQWGIAWRGAGSVTITVTRNVDSAEATFDVTLTSGETFSASLGDAVPE